MSEDNTDSTKQNPPKATKKASPKGFTLTEEQKQDILRRVAPPPYKQKPKTEATPDAKPEPAKWIREKFEDMLPPLLFGSLLMVSFGAYINFGKRTPPMTKAEKLARNVNGKWDNLEGKVAFVLNSDEKGTKVATVTVYDKASNYHKKEDKCLKSIGEWKTTDSTVIITANGAAGSFNMTFEFERKSYAAILAPAPASSALLKDCLFRFPGIDNE